jgi:hypothetical protein
MAQALWVTDKPSPLSLHSARAHHRTHLNLSSTCCQPSQHIFGSRAWNTRLVSQTRYRPLPGLLPGLYPGCAPAPHNPADRSVTLPSPCFASVPCPTACPSVLVFLNLVWPLSIKLVSPSHHPKSPPGRLIARSHSARLSRPPGINFVNAIGSATMTHFLNLSRTMPVNTGLNGIMA